MTPRPQVGARWSRGRAGNGFRGVVGWGGLSGGLQRCVNGVGSLASFALCGTWPAVTPPVTDLPPRTAPDVAKILSPGEWLSYDVASLAPGRGVADHREVEKVAGVLDYEVRVRIVTSIIPWLKEHNHNRENRRGWRARVERDEPDIRRC